MSKFFAMGRADWNYADALPPSGTIGGRMWNSARKFGPIEPAVISWQPGSDIIGDFVSAAFCKLAKRSVGEELASRFGGLSLGPVEMFQLKSVKPPKTKARFPRVLLPYQGPELCELWPNTWLPCEVEDNRFEWRIDAGVKIADLKFDPSLTPSAPQHVRGCLYERDVSSPRLYVKRSDLNGLGIFCLRGFRGAIFVTEDVMTFILDKQWMGVHFFEEGVIV